MPVEVSTLDEAQGRSFTGLAIHYKVEAPSYLRDTSTDRYNYPRALCNTPAAGYYTTNEKLITCVRCRRNALGGRS